MDRSTGIWVVASALFVIVLWGSSPWLIPWWFSKTVGCGNGIESFGQFGDMLGFATSLFTGLTVIGLVLTIRLQQTQIIVQRQELSDAATEAKEQRTIANNQLKELQNQRFEERMFRLIDSNRSIYQVLRDHNTFETFESKHIDPVSWDNVAEHQRTNYNVNIDPHITKNLGNYFLSLRSFIQYLNDTPKETKEKYFSILGAQLDVNERRLLLYNQRFGSMKLDLWDDLRPYFFEGFRRDYVNQNFRETLWEILS